MLMCKYITKKYKQDCFFDFQGQKYRVHSIVRLTEEGQHYLGSRTREVILTEQFTNWDGRTGWKYQFREHYGSVVDYSTDRTPDELIEEIVVQASADYAEREIFGIDAPSYTTGKKQTKKDWEIPEVRNGWIILILILIGVSIFKDWYVQLIIRAAASWIFGLYRQAYINAYTTYIHDEDTEIRRKKLEVLYGVKFNKEDNSNE